MRVGSLDFRPGVIPSLAFFLLLPLLLSLGFWQLDRAGQKEVLQKDFAARTLLPPVFLAELDPADPDSQYRRIRVRGRYDGERQILLDNQIENGRPGYHVYTPLRIAGRAEVILVNRGWAPMGETRRDLPELAVTGAGVTIAGRLAQPANPGLRLADPAAADWPRVVQYVDYDALSAALGNPLIPAVVLLDPEEAEGYRRDWRPTFGGLGPERHLGYAVQWFALAATLVVIYVAVNTRRVRRPEQTNE